MREKAWDGGWEGSACMCEKVARESMLPIMRMRVDACVKVEAVITNPRDRAETSERGLPASVWRSRVRGRLSDRLHTYYG